MSNFLSASGSWIRDAKSRASEFSFMERFPFFFMRSDSLHRALAPGRAAVRRQVVFGENSSRPTGSLRPPQKQQQRNPCCQATKTIYTEDVTAPQRIVHYLVLRRSDTQA